MTTAPTTTSTTNINKKTAKKNKLLEIFEKKEFFYGIGRRKSAIAQVRLYKEGKGRIYVNTIEYRKYFSYFEFQKTITKALDLVKEKQNIDISVKVSGGGMRGQADATLLAIARAIIQWKEEYREKLSHAGMLTRDAREKERKKPGLKSARRAPQWAKR